jgi:hypothetical protein
MRPSFALLGILAFGLMILKQNDASRSASFARLSFLSDSTTMTDEGISGLTTLSLLKLDDPAPHPLNLFHCEFE